MESVVFCKVYTVKKKRGLMSPQSKLHLLCPTSLTRSFFGDRRRPDRLSIVLNNNQKFNKSDIDSKAQIQLFKSNKGNFFDPSPRYLINLTIDLQCLFGYIFDRLL